MSAEDQFEQRLRKLPPRQVPPAWREEILSAARTAAPATASSVNGGLSWLALLNSRLTALFWPHPIAWGALASVWLLVIGLNLSSQAPVSYTAAKHTTPISSEMRKLLRQQEQLFAELAGSGETTEMDRPKPTLPSPQSRRREDFANV